MQDDSGEGVSPAVSQLDYEEMNEFENFHTSMLIGPIKSPILVSFDTDTDELFVKNDYCTTCTGEGQFDEFTAMIDDMPTIPRTSSQDRFGFSTTLTGNKVASYACIDEDHCIADFEWVRCS